MAILRGGMGKLNFLNSGFKWSRMIFTDCEALERYVTKMKLFIAAMALLIGWSAYEVVSSSNL